ncbi:DDE-type integrase/transposase/recombinase [Chromobacterium sphagni]|uniref:DDE-type integrase/transposase/recombinase n=1 Tax=Chromobacterium sphagni TaxID=1903179 RepID=UPI003B980045
MGEHMTTDLVLMALNMALEQRRPGGVIHHLDQGSQYTSLAFGERCRQMKVRPSMGTLETPTTMQWRRVSLPVWKVS